MKKAMRLRNGYCYINPITEKQHDRTATVRGVDCEEFVVIEGDRDWEHALKVAHMFEVVMTPEEREAEESRVEKEAAAAAKEHIAEIMEAKKAAAARERAKKKEDDEAEADREAADEAEEKARKEAESKVPRTKPHAAEKTK